MIKICGMKREIDIDYANELLPDYVGFVFAKSKRQISFEKACRLKKILCKKIEAVGVFVEEDMNNIIELADNNVIDLIQLHGKENENYIAQLKKRVNKKIIKVVKIGNNFPENYNFETSADYLLFDNLKGGSGKKFDWEKIKGYQEKFFLAGGLNIDNIGLAKKIINPYCFDISSGVETHGFKDFEKMKKIMEFR